MKTVLIVGAGATRAAAGQGSPKSRPPLDNDFFEIAKSINKRSYDRVYECLYELVGDYAPTLMHSLEEVTAYLYIKALDGKNQSQHHLAFITLLRLINEVLAETTNKIKIGPRGLMYRFLLSELERVSQAKDLSIITFNYDLLIERTLDQIAARRGSDIFSFPGCYRLSEKIDTTHIHRRPQFSNISEKPIGVEVLKLHGSLSWQSRHGSNIPSTNGLFRNTRDVHIMNSPYISSSLTWKPDSKTIYLKPVIVPPVSGKRGMMHKALHPVWKKAASALRTAERVIVAGYSCPPLDIEARILLSENLRSNKNARLYIIDPNTAITSRFVEVCGVRHATVYGSIQQWVDDSKKYPSS